MKAVILALALCTVISCSKQEEKLCLTSGQIEPAIFLQDSKMDSVLSIRGIEIIPIRVGNNFVFKYLLKRRGCFYPDLDIEVFFETPSSFLDFTFENNLSESINFQYRSECESCLGEFIFVDDGTVSGEMIDSTSWLIKVDATVDIGSTLETISIDQKFCAFPKIY